MVAPDCGLRDLLAPAAAAHDWQDCASQKTSAWSEASTASILSGAFRSGEGAPKLAAAYRTAVSPTRKETNTIKQPPTS
jgi:hypothetical protein